MRDWVDKSIANGAGVPAAQSSHDAFRHVNNGLTTFLRIGRMSNATRSMRPADWQLPTGVDRALWDYLVDESIANDFDRYIEGASLVRIDCAFLETQFSRPGRLIDLGCGVGRVLIHFARRGFETVGVDLSEPMLRLVRDKARMLDLRIGLARANICDLEIFADGSFDYASCMFSTLGMVVSRENRRKVLLHVNRLLSPKGVFVLHVHNFWYNLQDPQGRRWLLSHLFSSAFRPACRGDKIMCNYRGIPNLRLHLFTRREINREMAAAGFREQASVPLSSDCSEPLTWRGYFPALRANGWLFAYGKKFS